MPQQTAKEKVINKLIKEFKEAVEEKAFEGTIPYLSDDPEEQEALDAEHKRINERYVAAEIRLRQLML